MACKVPLGYHFTGWSAKGRRGRHTRYREGPIMRGQRVAQATTQTSHAKRLRFSKDPLRMLLFLLTIVTISKIHALFGFLAVVRPAMTLALLTLAYAWLNP